MIRKIIVLIAIVVFGAGVYGQTNDFTYQGTLNEGSNPANGTYDLEFKLYDSAAGGVLLATLTRSGVQVVNGIFTVVLDFGVPFPGPERYVEISVRRGGTPGGYQQLLPRQRVTSTPYALRAQTAGNAISLGGTAAGQYVQTSDPRLIDARPPTAGSGNYIQNQNGAVQPASNFNISGNGTAGGSLSANVVNAASQFNFNSNSFLFSSGRSEEPNSNTVAGIGSGVSIIINPDVFMPSGLWNSFFGNLAGNANTIGQRNSFFGRRAGVANTQGGANSIFGSDAGAANTTGHSNSFFGRAAGIDNISGTENSFFGAESGFNTNATRNTFVGYRAGSANTTGNRNTFIGYGSVGNTTGSDNTVLGSNTSLVPNNLSFTTVIGAGAAGTTNNSIFLGRPGGEDTVRIPGLLNVTGSTTLNGNFVMGSGGLALFSSPIALTTSGLGTSGGTSLCRNGSSQIALCSSSLRYKSNIRKFQSGLQLIKQLQPISFDWRDGQARDLGLGAEDVAAIEPLLVTYNDNGQVEGVKYDRIGVVLLNAIKEQQAQIEQLTEQNRKQQLIIDRLVKSFCRQSTNDAVCKEEK